MVPFDAERLVECPCASRTSISRVLPEISAFEVPVSVSCIASTTGTPDSCQQTVCHGGDVQCCSDLLLLWRLLTCLVDAEESRRVGLSARCCSLPAAWPAPAAENIGWLSHQDQPYSSLGSPSSSPSSSSSSSPSLLHRLPHQPGLFPSDKYYGRLFWFSSRYFV